MVFITVLQNLEKMGRQPDIDVIVSHKKIKNKIHIESCSTVF